MRRISLIYALLVSGLVTLALSACDDTVRGMGRDINQTADAVEDETD